MATPSSPKRFVTAVLLGIGFGVLCAYLASRETPSMWDLQNPIFWSIVTDRILIGVAITIAGAFVRHPLFGFRCYPWMRGLVLGAIFSLPIATGAMANPPSGFSAWTLFWMSIGAGAFYGIIIDLVATAVGGQGKGLLQE